MWCWVGIDKDNTTFGPSDAPIFRNVALLTLGVGGLCSLIFHFLVKLGSNVDEKKPHSGNVVSVTDKNEDVRKDAETALSNQQVGAQEEICSENDSPLCSENTKIQEPMSILSWLCEPQLYQIGALYVFSRLFVNMSQAYMALYLNTTLELPATYVAIIPMIMYISGIFAAIVAKPTSRYFGIKITCGIYSILGIFACLWIHWGKIKWT